MSSRVRMSRACCTVRPVAFLVVLSAVAGTLLFDMSVTLLDRFVQRNPIWEVFPQRCPISPLNWPDASTQGRNYV